MEEEKETEEDKEEEEEEEEKEEEKEEEETAEDKEEEEEKEEEEIKEKDEDLHDVAAALSVDYQGLPIMHWEELSQRIAELEQQEQERSKGGSQGGPPGGRWRDVWDQDEEDCRRCRVAMVTSRLHSHRKLQLCFINNSDSEDELEGSNKVSMGTGHNGCHGAGLKQEVVVALRTLRDKLLAEQTEKERLASSSCVAERKHLERWELQERSVQQLRILGASLQQDVHAFSSELVAQLVVRDQLRTKQDAMLLDVQDLT